MEFKLKPLENNKLRTKIIRIRYLFFEIVTIFSDYKTIFNDFITQVNFSYFKKSSQIYIQYIKILY